MALSRIGASILRVLRAAPPATSSLIRGEIEERLEYWAPSSTIYRTLRDLDRDGYIESDIRPKGEGPGRPSQTYKITAAGRRALAKEDGEDETSEL